MKQGIWPVDCSGRQDEGIDESEDSVVLFEYKPGHGNATYHLL